MIPPDFLLVRDIQSQRAVSCKACALQDMVEYAGGKLSAVFREGSVS